MNNTKILSTQYGDIFGDGHLEKVMLIGDFEPESSFVHTLYLVIIDHQMQHEIFKLPLEGYAFTLFIGRISQPNQDDLLIIGDYGGSGGYAIVNLYHYQNKALKLVFDNESFSETFKCTSHYLLDHKVEIICHHTNKKYQLLIENKPNDYFDFIYDKNGHLLPHVAPSVSDLNTVGLIPLLSTDAYRLLLQQKIIGIANADILGIIQTVIQLNSEGNMMLIDQTLLSFGTEIK